MCDLLQVLRVSGPRSIAFLFTSRGISILVHFPVQHSRTPIGLATFTLLYISVIEESGFDDLVFHVAHRCAVR